MDNHLWFSLFMRFLGLPVILLILIVISKVQESIQLFRNRKHSNITSAKTSEQKIKARNIRE
jgi:ABC-type phosphate transport system permease subunit